MRKDGELAFPSGGHAIARGMTLCDWFAGQALAGLCANLHGEEIAGHVAKAAYRIADAMLAEREKGGGDGC